MAIMPDTTTKLPPEAADFLTRHPETRHLDAIFPDLSGVVRGKRYPMSEFGKVMTDGLAFPASVFMLDSLGQSHDPAGLGFSDGDPDRVAKIVPGTLLPVPWAQQPGAQALITLSEADGTSLPFRTAQHPAVGTGALEGTGPAARGGLRAGVLSLRLGT